MAHLVNHLRSVLKFRAVLTLERLNRPLSEPSLQAGALPPLENSSHLREPLFKIRPRPGQNRRLAQTQLPLRIGLCINN